MRRAFHQLLLALSSVESGASCRRCGETIAAKDPFGTSEAVCRPCRSDENEGSRP